MAMRIHNTMDEKVIDPNNSKSKYIVSISMLDIRSPISKQIVIDYLSDMEKGVNVSHKAMRGPRSYSRLLTLTYRMKFLANMLENLYSKDLMQLSESDVHDFFLKMRRGEIRKQDGSMYKSVGDYVKIFKAFWNWHIRKSKKEGKLIDDITVDLDTQTYDKPKWVYFTFQDLQTMAEVALYKYKVLMYFMFDSGIRGPHELVNVKRKDIVEIDNGKKLQLNIRDETSKTFGRKIKLMLSSDILRLYLERNKFDAEDFIFSGNPIPLNRYLRKIGERVLNKPGITMYDFRHNSACYWLPRYKSESALKYRFGWKKSEMIHYYTEFLGMRDTIQDDDMYVDVSKGELEKELEAERQKRVIIGERLEQMERQLSQISQQFLQSSIKPQTEKAIASNDSASLLRLAKEIREKNLAAELIKLL